MAHIKKFNENSVAIPGDNNNPNYRLDVNKKAFMLIMTEIKEIMVSNYDNPTKVDWGTIGGIYYINDKLLNIIATYNEEKANEIRKMLD